MQKSAENKSTSLEKRVIIEDDFSNFLENNEAIEKAVVAKIKEINELKEEDIQNIIEKYQISREDLEKVRQLENTERKVLGHGVYRVYDALSKSDNVPTNMKKRFESDKIVLSGLMGYDYEKKESPEIHGGPDDIEGIKNTFSFIQQKHQQKNLEINPTILQDGNKIFIDKIENFVDKKELAKIDEDTQKELVEEVGEQTKSWSDGLMTKYLTFALGEKYPEYKEKWGERTWGQRALKATAFLPYLNSGLVLPILPNRISIEIRKFGGATLNQLLPLVNSFVPDDNKELKNAFSGMNKFMMIAANYDYTKEPPVPIVEWHDINPVSWLRKWSKFTKENMTQEERNVVGNVLVQGVKLGIWLYQVWNGAETGGGAKPQTPQIPAGQNKPIEGRKGNEQKPIEDKSADKPAGQDSDVNVEKVPEKPVEKDLSEMTDEEIEKMEEESTKQILEGMKGPEVEEVEKTGSKIDITV